jgi:hypothetical protein
VSVNPTDDGYGKAHHIRYENGSTDTLLTEVDEYTEEYAVIFSWQTASVQPAITENIQIGEEDAKPVKLPLLTDVPIYFPRANGYCITLPIAKGDECLLVFADMCLDGWWQSGGVQDQMETRRHDLSDAIAIVGITSQPRKVTAYDPGKLQIRTDDQGVITEIDKAEQAVNVVRCRKLTANVSELIDANCGGDVKVVAGGDVKVNAGGDINVSSDGDISIVAEGNILIKGAAVSINP